MGLLKGSFLLLGLAVIVGVTAAEVLVQINVNRPFNDVNEKFVSFSVKPEDLYNALDGPKQTTVTRMATLLGSSYVKLLGSYNFDKQNEFGMRNPTRIIWKGFNRWSRTVNWTMIVPIDYTPDDWEPMDTLKMLNNSYLSGIHDCIYEFGNDSTAMRAKSYNDDLKTFDLMLEAFRPNVHKWLAMGPAVSSSMSTEEISRYVDTSRDYNAAYGWKTDEKMLTSHQMDASLRTMLAKKVPLWLALPKQKTTKRVKAVALRTVDDEFIEGMTYAQVLGDAASSGFDAVFKYIPAAELETATFSTYVSMLFKKVMGSRVFPAKLLHLFKQDQKLYTHCANGISGGMAFMAINKEERPLHITISSLTRLKTTEVLQYSLSMKKGQIYLNGEKIYFNSTLTPYARAKTTSTVIKLLAPPLSVNYWVLPNVDLEHCQFLEMEEDDFEISAEEQKIVKKRHSAAEKLISQLIRDTKIPKPTFAKTLERSRRALDFQNNKNRISRSFPENNNLFRNNLLNREALGVFRQELTRRGRNALDWIQTVLDIVRAYDDSEPNLRRRPRAANDILDRKSLTTKKYKNNKKVEKSVVFDEQAFFRELEEILKAAYAEENVSDSEEEANESQELLTSQQSRWMSPTNNEWSGRKYNKRTQSDEISKTLNELISFGKNENSKRQSKGNSKKMSKLPEYEPTANDESLKKMQDDFYKALRGYASAEDSGETNEKYFKDHLENYSAEVPDKLISWWAEDDEEHKSRARRNAKFIAADSRENRVDSNEKYFPREPTETRKQVLIETVENIDKNSASNHTDEQETLSPHNFLDTVTKRVVKFIDVVTRHVNNFQVNIQPNTANTNSIGKN